MAEHKPFTWTSDLLIDGGPIDNDHKALIDIGNRVYQLSHPNEQSDELRTAIRELYDYTKYHFKREEAFMTKVDYPNWREHFQKHRRIVENMNHILVQSHNMKEVLDNFVELMNIWIMDHIQQEDRKLGKFLADHEDPGSP